MKEVFRYMDVLSRCNLAKTEYPAHRRKTISRVVGGINTVPEQKMRSGVKAESSRESNSEVPLSRIGWEEEKWSSLYILQEVLKTVVPDGKNSN